MIRVSAAKYRVAHIRSVEDGRPVAVVAVPEETFDYDELLRFMGSLNTVALDLRREAEGHFLSLLGTKGIAGNTAQERHRAAVIDRLDDRSAEDQAPALGIRTNVRAEPLDLSAYDFDADVAVSS